MIEARVGAARGQAAVQVTSPGQTAQQPPRTQVRPPVTPPVERPPAEQWGYVSINADPFGTVFINGVEAGPTPLDRFQVRPGPVSVRIESPGYRTITDRLQVDAGNTVRKRYTLIPEG